MKPARAVVHRHGAGITKDTIHSTFTNEELEKAIDTANCRAGTSTDLDKLWMAQLKVLLEIQRSRAAAVIESDLQTLPENLHT